jgi:hypothetical protein
MDKSGTTFMQSDERRTLGVHGTPSVLYLAVAEGGRVLDVMPQKIDVPGGLHRSSDLRAFSDECRRRLAEIHASSGAILLPQSYPAGTKGVVARVGAETVFRAEAISAGIEIELLARSTARSRLKHSQGGELTDLLAAVLPQAIGKYWNYRQYAAFAALAAGAL